MYILTRNNKVIDYSESPYYCVGSTVVCESKHCIYEDATIVDIGSLSLPADVLCGDYYYYHGAFVKIKEDKSQSTYMTRVNTNLLTNWYFANPVNRQGGFYFIPKGTPCYKDTALTPTGDRTDDTYPVEVVDETYSKFVSNGGNTWYVSTADVKYGYYQAGDTIDRWRIVNSPLTVKLDKKLTLDNSVGTSATYYGQNFEIDLTDRSVTLSVLTPEGLYSGTGVIKNNASWEIRFSVGENVEMYYQKDSSGFGVFFVLSAGAVLDIIAVKLELGDTQTLAYQDDSGNWQLYEIPNYEEELAKCRAHDEYLTSAGGTITGTLVLSNTTDANPAADNSPALIIGNRTGGHLEFDGNEIVAKSSETTATALFLGTETALGTDAEGVANTGTPRVRNIYAGTGTMNAGTTSLVTGRIYLQYE